MFFLHFELIRESSLNIVTNFSHFISTRLIQGIIKEMWGGAELISYISG